MILKSRTLIRQLNFPFSFCSPILFLLSFSAFASPEPFLLSDTNLIQEAKKSAPKLKEIESRLFQTKIVESQFDEGFQTALSAGASFAETRERPIFQFAPVFSPVSQIRVGVEKKYPFGTKIKSGLSIDQQSASLNFPGASNIDNATVNYGYLTVEMDLWKDLFGRTSYAQSDMYGSMTKQAELEFEINSNAFLLSVRKIYWNIVANQESFLISGKLLETAQRQLLDARARLKNSVSDRGEVARFQALVASRKARMTTLKYQRTLLEKRLLELIPALQGKRLELEKYDVNTTIEEVLACSAAITSHDSPPYDETLYNDVADFIEKEYQQREKVNRLHSDIDLSLSGTFAVKGVDNVNPGSVGGAFEDIYYNGRFAYQLGLNLKLPLDSRKSTTERYLQTRDTLLGESKGAQFRSQMEASFNQLKSSIQYLVEATRLEKENSDALSVRLREMEKKYHQARVSVTELITDQDAFFASSLTVIDIELELLNTIFDYLAVFTKTKCEFNQKI